MEDRRKAWVHTLAGTNGDMSRFGVMHPCGVAEAQRAIKRPKAKTERIAFAPIDQPPFFCGARAAPPKFVSVPRSLKLSMHNKPVPLANMRGH